MPALILSITGIRKSCANLFPEQRETANERQQMKKIITIIEAAHLAGCMTPVDYSKPQPLKDGETKRAKIKQDLPESERSIIAGKTLEFIGGGVGRVGRQAFD
jgi:hypothetical protein